MTYNPTVPNAAQSPGLFPPQNSNNFTRLKTMINADHVFNDTAQTTDGLHKQVTYIAKSAGFSPVIPTGANAMLYAMLDISGQAQLNFFNGVVNFQLTPFQPAPSKITGSVVLAGNTTSGTVYTVPDNSYGTIFVNYILPAGNFYRLFFFYKSASSFFEAVVLAESANTKRPDISLSGSNIRVVNGGAATQTVAYYIIVESV